MLQVQAHPVGRSLRAALRLQLRRLQAGDPIRPVTVAVPSNYAGLALRRALARPDDGDTGGLLNVRFMVLPRVIELIGAPVLAAAGQRPLTQAIEAEFIRQALEEESGSFAQVASHPATEQRLAASFRELVDMTSDERTSLASVGGTTADTVRLFSRVEAMTSGRFYHDRALAEAATQAVAAGHPALQDLGALVVYSPGPLPQANRVFVEALADVEDVVVLLGLTGEDFADAPIIEQWGGIEHGEPPAPSSATHIVSAPDADEEIRTAIRMVLQRMVDGTPPHRIAFLSRHAAPYGTLIASQLEQAELPWNGANPMLLSQMAASRILLGALALPERDFRRSDLVAWLSGAPVLLREHGDIVPAQRWDSLARSAGVVRGLDGWRASLQRHESKLHRNLEQQEQADDAADWKAAAIARDISEVGELRTFIDEAALYLQPPVRGSWDALATWARDVFERYAGTEASFAVRLPASPGVPGSTHTSELEVEAYRAVSDAIDNLAALAEIRPAVDLPTFLRVLRQELDRPARRIGRFGDGIFVGRIADAVGADFDHVFVVGMNEGSIPTKGSDDPLLPDHAWDAVEAPTSTVHRTRRARQRAEERRTYLAALASAPERTLLAPRADLRGEQGRFRSRWLLESASALAGRRLTNEAMDHVAEPWHTLVPSFEGALRGHLPAANLGERDLRALHAWRTTGRRIDEHPLAAGSGGLTDGWNSQRARRSPAFTRWDGYTPTLPAGICVVEHEHAHSPTSLERWAKCPRQYLFGSVLRIAEQEEPELRLQISALDRGSLIHEVLEQFISERRSASPDASWSVEDRARLRELSEAACDAAEAEGLTGAPLLWRYDREQVLEDLTRFLDVDEEYRRVEGVVPVASELSFGDNLPVEFTLADGRVVRLRGFIDRVDRSPDGTKTVVIDYKSGSAFHYRKLADDPVQGGRLLQLPVYALGAQGVYGVEEVDSRYWFTRSDIDARERFVGYPVDEPVLARFGEVLSHVTSGIAGGLFPAVPGKSQNRGIHEHCQFCPYNAICARDRGREHARKIAAPELLPLVSLRPAVVEDDEDAGGEE